MYYICPAREISTSLKVSSLNRRQFLFSLILDSMRALLCAFFQTSSNEATNIFKAANKNSLGKAEKN
jgi:hypothetical protein